LEHGFDLRGLQGLKQFIERATQRKFAGRLQVVSQLRQARKIRLQSSGHGPIVTRCNTPFRAIFNPISTPPRRKGAFWTLGLRFTPLPTNAMGAMSFNGISSDKISTMRARWLLLGEKPAPKNPPSGSGSDDWS